MKQSALPFLILWLHPDNEVDCAINPDPENTGYVSDIDRGCRVLDGYKIHFEDSVTINENITTIFRTWQANILCDYLEKIQTITINCQPACTPPNVGILECDN